MKTTVVVNLLTGADREASLIVEALNRFSTEVSSTLHRELSVYTLTPDPKNPPEDADRILVLAEHSDAAGAAGYHDLGSDGRPRLFAFRDGTMSGELLRDKSGGGDSLLAIAQHEGVEADADENADLYVAEPWIAPDGVQWSLRAKEHGDPAQGQCTSMTLKDGTVVDCTNFVTDAYFNPFARKGTKLDYMGIFKEPGELSSSGYQIAARIAAEKDVFADMVMHRGGGPHVKAMAAKKRPTSRTAKRIAKIVKALRAA